MASAVLVRWLAHVDVLALAGPAAGLVVLVIVARKAFFPRKLAGKWVPLMRLRARLRLRPVLGWRPCSNCICGGAGWRREFEQQQARLREEWRYLIPRSLTAMHPVARGKSGPTNESRPVLMHHTGTSIRIASDVRS
jgi:hypothetical protein